MYVDLHKGPRFLGALAVIGMLSTGLVSAGRDKQKPLETADPKIKTDQRILLPEDVPASNESGFTGE